MVDGVIIRAISGYYDVDTPDGEIRCRARGRMRYDKISPLVGDRVRITVSPSGEGTVEEICPRRNFFTRPAVANMDLVVMVAAQVVPVTDPFLIDRMTAIAAGAGADVLIALNKCDLDPADKLYEIYTKAGYPVLRVSAVTGQGVLQLRQALRGRTCVFTGNSGVGKSSLLNALDPAFALPVGEISEKLGRGRHTTRHVELFPTADGALIADTPGFSAFDVDRMELTDPEKLQYTFREFAPYLDRCRFVGCSHTRESGCAVLEAVKDGAIPASRHKSYVRLYDQLKSVNEWERKPVTK